MSSELPEVPKEKLWMIYVALLNAVQRLVTVGESPMIIENLKSLIAIMEIEWKEELDELRDRDKVYVDSINKMLPLPPPPAKP